MKTTISAIISSYYDELHRMLRDKDCLISECKTDEDHLQDVCLTAIRKFKDTPIEEEEGKEYLTKSLLMMLKFKQKRRDKNTVYIEDLPEAAEFPSPDSDF